VNHISRHIRRYVTLVSVVLIVAGALLAAVTGAWVASAERAPGVVESVGYLSRHGAGFPVAIAFRDSRGTPHHFLTETQRTLFDELDEGADVEVLYHEWDPRGTARVNQFYRMWLWPTLFVGFGLLFLLSRRYVADRAIHRGWVG
jgi:hypothetical protein